MGLYDVHAHLTDGRLLAREADVLANARAAGVTTIIANGLHPADNEAVRALAARAPVEIVGAESAAVSFPGFFERLRTLGASIQPVGGP